MPSRSAIYQYGKRIGAPVQWRSKTVDMRSAIEKFAREREAKKVITGAVQSRDRKIINAINKLPIAKEITIPTLQFNRIFHDLHAPADKMLWATLMNSQGQTTKGFKITPNMISSEHMFIHEPTTFGSDTDYEIEVDSKSKISLAWYIENKKSKSARKNFFRYLTKLDFKLEKFQVYCLGKKRSNAETPCFIHALKQSGYNAQHIQNEMYHSGATNTSIKHYAAEKKIHISVKQFYEGESKKDFETTHYGDKSLPEICLGSVGKHLFAIKETKVSQYALDHPYLFENKKWPSIRAGKNKIRYLDSYSVISHLYKHRETMCETITIRNSPKLQNNMFEQVDELTEEDLKPEFQKEIGMISGPMNGNYPFMAEELDDNDEAIKVEARYNTVYFDFETLVKDDEHKPYCVAYKLNNEKTRIIYGTDCVEQMFESFPAHQNYLMWAHNLGFDARLTMKHLTSFGTIIDNGSRIKMLKCSYKNRSIVMKDTLGFLNYPLAKLPEMFSVETLEKESFPHDLINEDNFNKDWPIEYLKTFKDYDLLIKNATKIGAIKDDMFKTVKYATHYCIRDVDVLEACFTAFRNSIQTKFKQDVYNHISIPALTYAIQHNEGCFDGVYSLKSTPLAFIRKALVGGRTMTKRNEKHHTKHQLVDFDGVSLYPSAQVRLGGYVKGRGKFFKSRRPKNDYFIARVRIDSVGIERDFPLISVIDAVTGSRNFTNDLCGKTFIIDRFTLEDLIKFQEVGYTLFEGIYWDEGINSQIKTTITTMFNERLAYKAAKNPLQETIKLLLNSSYGKLIQKPIVKQKQLVKGVKACDEYLRIHMNSIHSRTYISEELSLFEEDKASFNHWSPAHLGVAILSTSKRIMNEVMCLAEDEKIPMWYQDTDSIHMDRDCVDKLAKAFRNTYKRELIGKNLGQFHSDFSLEGSEGEVYAIESIFLGKKSYMDVLRCSGNDAQGDHIRMKGCPSRLIKEDALDKYAMLYQGGPKDVLTVEMANCCPINIDSRTMKITKRTSFIRRFSFPTV